MSEFEPVMSELGIARSPLQSHMLALSTALVVVISGAMLARAAVLPQAAGNIAMVAQEVSLGFGTTFGNASSYVATMIDTANAAMSASTARVVSARDAYQSSSPLAAVDAASLVSIFVKNYHSADMTVDVPSTQLASVPPVTVADLYASVLDAYAFVTTPPSIVLTMQHASVALGAEAYSSIATAFSAYGSLIDRLQTMETAAGSATFNSLASIPDAAVHMSVAIGNTVVDATHAAIYTDVSASYGIAAAAPASARATVVFMGVTGSILAGATARVPALATAAYLRATAAPATLAPALAQAVFGAEYAAATRFVGATDAISGRYLALVEGAGSVAYQGTAGSLALTQTFSRAPAAVEDAYLGALGKGAVALAAVTPASSLAAVALAAQPALSLGEQTALTVYQTIHSIFNSTTNALATLFGPTVPEIITAPPTAAPSATSTPTLVLATSTPAAGGVPAIRQTVNTYPTYTTLVQGISQNALDQALASLRSGILATTAGMIQPVAAQGATNATTIQYVNMIQDLSNLTVHNGDFKGGTFDSGNLTNGISVSATNGTFTNLTGTTADFTSIIGGPSTLATTTVAGKLAINGNASITGSLTIGTTTITGPLAVSGTATLGPIVTAGSFVATSSEATSTFAGSLAIDTNGFVYATSTKDVGIGVLSPAALLAIRNSTSTQPVFTASSAAGTELYRITDAGFVGIGTTTPLSRLAVSGGATIGADYNVAAPANGLLVEGSLGIGTTTTDAALSLLQRTNGDPIISAYRATDTAPSGDFISYKSAAGAPLFRVDNSGNITGGGIINTGSVTITSTSSPQFRVQYDPTNEWTMTTTATGSTTLGVNGTAPALTFTPQSNATSTFSFTNATSNSILSIDTLHGRIGIGTTTPASILDIYGTDALHLPVGTSGERPSMALTGQVRYNTTTHQFEGYGDNAVWQGLGGVINPAQTTYITAGVDDFLRFVTASVERMTITNTGLIGIGTTTPFAQFSLAGSAGSATPLFAISTSTAAYATSTALAIDSNGNLSLQNGAGLSVGGALTVSGKSLFANATSTAFFATTASSTNLFAANASFGSLTANSLSLASPLAVASGGTGQSSFPASSLLYGSGTGALQSVATSTLTGTSITIGGSGALVGGTGLTANLNLANANTWTALQTFSNGISLTGSKLTNLANGTNPNDAVNYSQLTAMAVGLDPVNPIATPGIIDDSLSTPPVSPVNEEGYIVGPSPTGAWAGLAGHMLEWSSATSAWVDVLTRAVAVGDRFGIAFETGTPAGGLAGKTADIATFTNATPGTYAYTFTTPVNTMTTAIDGVDSHDVGHMYYYNATSTAWVDFATGVTPVAGNGLSLNGAVLSLNLANANTWTGLQQFNANASTTELTTTGSTYLATLGGNVGIGTTTPWGQLSVNPNGITGPAFVIGSSTATDFVVANSGNVGIGTTTPGSLLSLGNTGGINFTLATSTFSTTGGINLTSGCFAVNGVCAGTGSGTVGTGTQGQLPFYNAAGTNLVATSSIFLAQNGNVGIGTTTPNWNLQIAGIRPSFALTDTSAGTNLKHWLFSGMGGNLYIGTSTDAYATSTPSALTILNNGNVGIGTTSPFTTLGVVGNQRIKTTTNMDNAFTVENASATSTLAVSTLDSSSNIFSVASSTGQSFFEIMAGGNVGIGTTSPETTLTVVGAICAARSAGTQTTAWRYRAGRHLCQQLFAHRRVRRRRDVPDF